MNGEINGKLINQALELLGPTADARILDLFCGVGNFSLPLARRAGQVTGMELDTAMTTRASRNAELNDIRNVSFRAVNLADPDLIIAALSGLPCDGVLMDPPRTGAEALLGAVAASGARRIVYVSCHPATLARDAGQLVRDHGYRLAAAGILDMFPQTSHVESIALFDRC